MRRKKIFRAMSLLLVLLLLSSAGFILSGCGDRVQAGSTGKAQDSSGGEVIRVAKQFGLVYAPLMVAEKKEFFSKYGLKVEWVTLGSGGAVREAMASGKLDAAFMGIPPFLIGWDKGLPAKIAAGYTVSPVQLVTYDQNIKGIKDFRPEHKIALPSPGSVQHILLAMALEKELGDPKALDDNLVALPHPDGTQAMLAKKDVVAHFTTPPYLFEELAQPGYRVVLDGFEAFGGEFNFNVLLVTKDYHDRHPAGYAAFIMGLNDAMNWLNEHKMEAAELLAPEFKIEKEKLYRYLTSEGLNFTTAPYGLLGFAEFMKKAGYISKVPRDLSEIAWENVLAVVGKREGEPCQLEKMQLPR
ncbi:ABC transporter substrate-binding protein [Thermosediminibacter litoriperuensis]|uniref:NitT/TauT family transport system substrate-binding protein n=1 Tax=Thermosediminibacter litoriperuensis TaxID=291989 RepID=A0A5S5AVS9_9FIRM|nr:ABC transporter substrate-binding protein [Thermosediminibacter litoriperuensis]TYP57445.1 NitT/TauT family transport system substrate-binding protein [Thermosediminibacter litoriperuensis]